MKRRQTRLFTQFTLFTVCLLMGCSGGERSTSNQGSGSPGTPPRAAEEVERLSSVDISGLTENETRVWVALINDLLSPCGDPISVGQCASASGACQRCVPAARYLLRLIEEGYERAEIEELYGSRYSEEGVHEFELEGSPLRGSPMAQVTLVEFSDFECPFCGRAHPVIQRVLREFDGRVNLYFKQYPLPMHPNAGAAARASLAAGNQGKFWEMHDLLFEHQQALGESELEAYARQLDLDVERFLRDLSSDATQARVDADREQGSRAGVDGTPSIYVNGRAFNEPLNALTAYIREELGQ